MYEKHSAFQYWECRACDGDQTFPTAESFSSHTRLSHKETITEAQIPILVQISLKHAPVLIKECPLCIGRERKELTVDPHPLLDHIGDHIHEFSLRSLPWADSIADEPLKMHAASVERVRDWFSTWPTPEKGEHHQPAAESKPYRADDTKYSFACNEYFAESCKGSSRALGEISTSEEDADSNQAWRSSGSGSSNRSSSSFSKAGGVTEAPVFTNKSRNEANQFNDSTASAFVSDVDQKEHFECCRHQFNTKSSFTRHRLESCRARERQPKQFLCDHCGKSYARRFNLKQHLRKLGLSAKEADDAIRKRYADGMRRRQTHQDSSHQ